MDKLATDTYTSIPGQLLANKYSEQEYMSSPQM